MNYAILSQLFPTEFKSNHRFVNFVFDAKERFIDLGLGKKRSLSVLQQLFLETKLISIIKKMGYEVSMTTDDCEWEATIYNDGRVTGVDYDAIRVNALLKAIVQIPLGDNSLCKR